MNKRILVLIIILGILLLTTHMSPALAFVEKYHDYSTDPPGFFYGIWHGLLAPYSLIARWFGDFEMYATPNTGWFYDFGFLIGVTVSIPVGWIAAIISTISHVFF